MADNKKPVPARPAKKKSRAKEVTPGEADDMERENEREPKEMRRQDAAPPPTASRDKGRDERLDHDEDDYRDRDDHDDYDDDRGPRRDFDEDRDRDYPEDRNRDRQRQPQNDARRENPAGERRDERAPQGRPSDEYLLQVYYDKGARAFIGSVLEFPEIKSSGNSREGVIRDLETKINNSLENMRRRNEVLPEGFFNRRQPEKIEVKVSQSLFRRLEILARAEKVGVDQLLPELITAALERRADKRPEPQRQPQPQHNRDRDHRGNRQGGQRHGGRGRNYHETMDSRENFMEYVRNLEKGNFRKK